MLPRVLLLGDSIRLGYQPRVAECLAGIARVVGPEANGGDTRNLLAHLDAWALGRDPAIVHVNAGLHDIKRARGGGMPQVSPEEYARNVHALLSRLRGETRARIVWATMTPVDESRHTERKVFDRYLADVQAYNAAAVAVAESLGVAVNDLYAQAIRLGGSDLLWEDGIHFTDDGYPLLGDAVAAFLRPLITETVP